MTPSQDWRKPVPITWISSEESSPLWCADCGAPCLRAYWLHMGTPSAAPSCADCARARSDAQAALLLKRRLVCVVEGRAR